MTIKVLKLCQWMTQKPDGYLKHLQEKTLQYYKRIDTRFNRPGLYLSNHYCWFEMADGRAYEYRETDFRCDLFYFTATELNQWQGEALKAIVEQKLATGRQKNLYFVWLSVAKRRNLDIEHKKNMKRLLSASSNFS